MCRMHTLMHMHTHCWKPLYCYSYSLSYNHPNKEVTTIFRMLLKIDFTKVQYLCSRYWMTWSCVLNCPGLLSRRGGEHIATRLTPMLTRQQTVYNPGHLSQFQMLENCITHHPSPITHLPSPITHHTSPTTYHPSPPHPLHERGRSVRPRTGQPKPTSRTSGALFALGSRTQW